MTTLVIGSEAVGSDGYRGEVLAVKHEEYVEAMRVLGESGRTTGRPSDHQ